MGIDLLESLIGEGQENAIKELLSQHPHLANETTSLAVSPIMLAAYYKKFAIASLIASYKKDLTSFEAVAIGNIVFLNELIVKNGSVINDYSEDGFTALGLACLFGNLDIVQFLVQQNADVNLPTNNGFNVFPIHAACAANHLPIVKVLLNAGAKVNVVQQSGLSPLHIAAEFGNIEMIISLLENGAETNCRMEGGKLPADIAAEKGYAEIADILRD